MPENPEPPQERCDGGGILVGAGGRTRRCPGCPDCAPDEADMTAEDWREHDKGMPAPPPQERCPRCDSKIHDDERDNCQHVSPQEQGA
jgi:hypothetical protein